MKYYLSRKYILILIAFAIFNWILMYVAYICK